MDGDSKEDCSCLYEYLARQYYFNHIHHRDRVIPCNITSGLRCHPTGAYCTCHPTGAPTLVQKQPTNQLYHHQTWGKVSFAVEVLSLTQEKLYGAYLL